jgi:hypothetical protein
MLGTTSIAEDDAGNKYFLASPNCVPAAVHPNKVLHSLCFEKRPAAKNSVCPIPFHLVSLKLSSPKLTPNICRLEHFKKAGDESYFERLISLSSQFFPWKEQETCHYAPILWRHRLSRFFLHHYQTRVGRS